MPTHSLFGHMGSSELISRFGRVIMALTSQALLECNERHSMLNEDQALFEGGDGVAGGPTLKITTKPLPEQQIAVSQFVCHLNNTVSKTTKAYPRLQNVPTHNLFGHMGSSELISRFPQLILDAARYGPNQPLSPKRPQWGFFQKWTNHHGREDPQCCYTKELSTPKGIQCCSSSKEVNFSTSSATVSFSEVPLIKLNLVPS